MRRALILGLALSVIAAGLMPLSACALLSAKMAECADPTPQSPCDQMSPHNSPAQSIESSGKSCCVSSRAPLPEMQFNAILVGPAPTILVAQNLLNIPGAAAYAPLPFLKNPSPPSSQSLLCTFLI